MNKQPIEAAGDADLRRYSFGFPLDSDFSVFNHTCKVNFCRDVTKLEPALTRSGHMPSHINQFTCSIFLALILCGILSYLHQFLVPSFCSRAISIASQ